MNLVFSAILLLSCQGELDSYHLQIDTVYLDTLYEYPLEDLQFPAFVETPAGACSCLAGFRGGTSLLEPKKSWKLILEDTTLLDCYHVLLDAQYRDRTFMRNALGLRMSREMGLPAPLTEHVKLYINGAYFGVYVKVERIDRYFYTRNDLPEGYLFKSESHLGRMVWQPCDTIGTAGFEAERGSDEELYLIRSLIDRVNLDGQHEVNSNDFLTNAAISMAILDADAITKNYYIHYMPGGSWRIYPWDRDATFGNRWNGEYQPGWEEESNLFCFSLSPLLNLFLRDELYRQLYNQRLIQIAEIMANEYPGMIDSIYYEIQESVYDDTLKNGTNQDFEEAVATLRQDVIERAEYLPSIADVASPIEVVSQDLSQWNIQPDRYGTVTLTVEFKNPPSNAKVYFWSDYGEVESSQLSPVGTPANCWTGTFTVPEEEDHIRFSVNYHISTPQGSAGYFYPTYGYPLIASQRICSPTVRVSSFPVHHQDLDPQKPVRFSSFLWALPLVNRSGIPLDMSFYGIQTGNPPARMFFPESTYIDPGDTIFVTNDRELLKVMMSAEENIFGNLVTDSISGTKLRIIAPSWETVSFITLQPEQPCMDTSRCLVLSEICFSGPSGDWFELFNNSINRIDLSEFLVVDGNGNRCTLPAGLCIEPGEFCVICSCYDEFYSYFGSEPTVIQAINFGLNNESDGISMFLDDKKVFSILYDDVFWPLEEDLIYLSHPEVPFEFPSSWESSDLPGTPGKPNPGWPRISYEPVLRLQSPNPTDGELEFEYALPEQGNYAIYDLTGRKVLQGERFTNLQGTESIELPQLIRSGMYFLVVQSGGRFTSSKFLLIR
ncbi:MAG: T9SS type A sorting domain-containing protein [Candidatus Aegiribacteria sp.]|nr:T9SS type A sorting domain-containing protein [Candidatus Aegiribacteria sp.]